MFGGLFGGLGGNQVGIDELTTGISSAGMETYVENLKAELITKTEDLINDVSEIETTIKQGWQGVSRDKFLTDFAKARENTINDLKAEYANLRARLAELQTAYFKADENLYQ